MKDMSWDEYYAGFYDWSLSTQKNYSYRLTDFGDPEEIFEIVNEFAFYDSKFATKFVEKALAAGVRFLPEHILEMTILIDKPVLSKAAESVAGIFDREQLEEIHMLIDDSSFEYIARKAKIDIFADDAPVDEEPELEYEEPEFHEPTPHKKSLGFFGTLFAVLAAIGSVGGSKKKGHNGRCNGDCANCPPHYGYRYGRWYYGHDHVHGCEFSGNKGSGSMD